jgi:hypothetical protein
MDLNQIFWTLRLGMPKNKASIYDIRHDVGNYIKNPVFFLSTGRCGTKWFSELLKRDKSLAIFHQPVPSFAMQGKKIYEWYAKGNGNLSESEQELIMEMFWAGREDYLRYTYKTSKRYIETNNYITFFAPVLKQIFPDAKFVHLIRHPGEFVRSGVARSYYSGNIRDLMRPVPITGSYLEKWKDFGRIEKTAWLWNETNMFIQDFLKTLPSNQFEVFDFSKMNEGSTRKLISFLGTEVSDNAIVRSIPKRKNNQKKHTIAPFQEWSDEEKRSVNEITSAIGERFNYSF